MDRATIVNNILSGQSSPPRVIAFNAAEGCTRDVTEDIEHRPIPDGRTGVFGKGAESFYIRGRLIRQPTIR